MCAKKVAGGEGRGEEGGRKEETRIYKHHTDGGEKNNSRGVFVFFSELFKFLFLLFDFLENLDVLKG